MKVKELKELLKDIPDDYEVIMSSDGEGNEYSPLAGADEAMYEASTTWCGYVYSEEDAQEDKYEYVQNALILYPTN